MVFNILNGDALAHSFSEAKIQGTVVVFREALIEGDLSGNSLNDFWRSRARHHEVSEEDYHQQIVNEVEKILTAPDNSEFDLWFEYDLFCQVNMWCMISIINGLAIEKKVYAVYTSHLDKSSDQFWNGFGPADSEELNFCFTNRIALNENDLHLGNELWNAYKTNNDEELTRLSKKTSNAFPYLQEVVKAQIDRFPKDGTKGRPEKAIEDILKDNPSDINKVMQEFWKRESIYGFGDSQIKRIYQKVIGG